MMKRLKNPERRQMQRRNEEAGDVIDDSFLQILNGRTVLLSRRLSSQLRLQHLQELSLQNATVYLEDWEVLIWIQVLLQTQNAHNLELQMHLFFQLPPLQIEE